MIVRDPVVLAGTLPRFLSVGDVSRLHMQIDNVEGPAAEYTVDLDLARPRRRPGRRAAEIAAAGGRRTGLADDPRHRRRAPAPRSSTCASPGPASTRPRASRCASSPAPPPWCAAPCARWSPARACPLSSDLLADILPGHRRRLRLGVAARRPRRAGAARRRSTATLTAARSRSSAGRCRCSTSTSSRRRSSSASTARPTSACATRSSACWPARIRTAPSASGASAARTSGSTPTSPTS